MTTQNFSTQPGDEIEAVQPKKSNAKLIAIAAAVVFLVVAAVGGLALLNKPDPAALGEKCGKLAAEAISDSSKDKDAEQCVKDAMKAIGVPETEDKALTSSTAGKSMDEQLAATYEKYPNLKPFFESYMKAAFSNMDFSKLGGN